MVYSVKTINYFVESKKTTWMIEFTQDLVLTLGVLAALARKISLLEKSKLSSVNSYLLPPVDKLDRYFSTSQDFLTSEMRLSQSLFNILETTFFEIIRTSQSCSIS